MPEENNVLMVLKSKEGKETKVFEGNIGGHTPPIGSILRFEEPTNFYTFVYEVIDIIGSKLTLKIVG